MQTKRYGLVISDWNMEPMTGYDLLKEVRASPEFSKTPFIMITAESKTENVIAAKKAGVNNYIVKPFNAATLKTKMEAVFPGTPTDTCGASRAQRSAAPAHLLLRRACKAAARLEIFREPLRVPQRASRTSTVEIFTSG
jgi:DNA-binding response OmpR family regulator